jgi:hypothetical protein
MKAFLLLFFLMIFRSLTHTLESVPLLGTRGILTRNDVKCCPVIFRKRIHTPVTSRNFKCSSHHVSFCPVCQEDEYIRRRVTNVVLGAMKRLQISRKMPLLNYMGAESWRQIIDHLNAKRRAWNSLHPEIPMTLTNTALDHIRPVSEFKDNSLTAKFMLCNHFTNLQPLLHEDNAWKGDFWSQQDEEYWHDHIILHTDYMQTYYPPSAPFQPSLLEAEGKGSSHPISHQT